MRINLISLRKGSNSIDRFFRIFPYNLHVLKSVTPENHEVRILDNHTGENLPEADIYCFSLYPTNHKSTYTIGKRLVEEGKRVIFGGPWVMHNSAESSEYCTSVVIGEAEEEWSNIIADAQGNNLKKIYTCPMTDLANFPVIDRSDMNRWTYNNFVLATRGCPNRCAFCDLHKYHGNRIRKRPINDVVAEIAGIKASASGLFKRIIFFTDADIVGDKDYAKNLFSQLRPLGMKWIAESSIDIATDKQLLGLAYDSGCRALFIGYESVERENLKYIKPRNAELDYLDLTKSIRDKGILVWGSFVFGFDHDTKQTFSKTIELCKSSGMDLTSFNLLLPLKGTKIRDQLKSEGRLTDDGFEPKNMTNAELVNGIVNIHKEFYSPYNVFKRYLSLRTSIRKSYRLMYLLFSLTFRYTHKRTLLKIDA